ncbi:MAG: hypothetical protein KGN00_06295 [Chloroflexota bacterium]|nr:hypothetical protein [Chloroflexota bacterium]MDE3193282.1 hypothetical protein [Chloroflexota bacterium]
MLDLVILAAVALGAFSGWRRGFIVPLVATGGTLLALYALYTQGASFIPSGTFGLGLGAGLAFIAGGILGRIGALVAVLVHRVGLLKRADQGLGVPLGGVLALVSVYFALVALVSFDDILAPFHGKPTVDAAAVAAVRAAVASDPQFAVMVDPKTLDEMAATAAKSAIPRDQVAKFSEALAFYESEVRPQLLGSILAPAILAVGEHVPFIGHHLAYPKP